MTMPIARSAIVIANMLLAFLVAFMQMLILICFGAVLGVNWGSSVLALGSVIASYALSMAGVSMLFASIARTRTQTLAMGLALSNLTSPLAGAWYPREMMPAILLDLGKLFPSGWAMQALRDVVLHQSTPASVTMHVVILLAFAAVFSWVGIKRFRYE
jgi:ABC-2 type transport system permease protein